MIKKAIQIKEDAGFTLIELVVSITIMGILSLVAAAIISIGIDSYNLFTSHSTMAREAQNTMRIMKEKIPMANPVTIMNATNRRFRFTTTSGQLVDFRFRNGHSDLRYNITGSQDREILHNITSFDFDYAKSDGSVWQSSDPVAEINRVMVNFSLSMLGESENYSFYFTIRN